VSKRNVRLESPFGFCRAAWPAAPSATAKRNDRRLTATARAFVPRKKFAALGECHRQPPSVQTFAIWGVSTGRPAARSLHLLLCNAIFLYCEAREVVMRRPRTGILRGDCYVQPGPPAPPTRVGTSAPKKSMFPLALKLTFPSSSARSSVNFPICSAKSACASWITAGFVSSSRKPPTAKPQRSVTPRVFLGEIQARVRSPDYG
jgi:hypothetical protein